MMIKLRGAMAGSIPDRGGKVDWSGEEGQSSYVRNAKVKRWKTSPTALGSLEI